MKRLYALFAALAFVSSTAVRVASAAAATGVADALGKQDRQ
jgi:hypothetical protein